MLDWRWPLAFVAEFLWTLRFDHQLSLALKSSSIQFLIVARQVAQTWSFTMRAIWWISVFTLWWFSGSLNNPSAGNCPILPSLETCCHVWSTRHPWTYGNSIEPMKSDADLWIQDKLRACCFFSQPSCQTLLAVRLRMGWSVVAIWNQICLNFNKRAKVLMNLACTYLYNHFSLRLDMTWYKWSQLNFLGVSIFEVLKKSVHYTRREIDHFWQSQLTGLVFALIIILRFTDSEFEFPWYPMIYTVQV